MLRALIASMLIALPGQLLAQDTARPNILLVLLDDAGFMDFGAYGSDTATPHIDGLATRAPCSHASICHPNAAPAGPC